MEAALGIGPARQALAWVGDHQGTHRGQGLLLDLPGEGLVVLTCHHVVATVPPKNLRVALPLPAGPLGERIAVRYDADRSRPEHDAAVLRLEAEVRPKPRPRPLLHALDPARYSGGLKTTGLTHSGAGGFGADLGPMTKALPYKGHDIVRPDWPDAPAEYAPPILFRLEDASDTQPGISGGVVLCEEGVLGLVSAGRAAGPKFEREAYLIPLSAWAQGWPELEDLIEPLLGTALYHVARIRHADTLMTPNGGDVTIAELQVDVYLEREVDEQARRALAAAKGVVVIVGRPLSGKTRLALELLRQRPNALVVMPGSPTAPPPSLVTTAGLAREEVILFVDDLHQTLSDAGPLEWRRLVTQTTGRPCRVICTSRDGADWKLARERHPHFLADLGEALVYTSRSEGRGADFTDDDGYKLAQKLGLDDVTLDARFEGTPGSLVLNLTGMKDRYEKLAELEVLGMPRSTLLDAAKILHGGGQPRLREPILRAVAEQIVIGAGVSNAQWRRLGEVVEEAGFGWWEPVEAAGVAEFHIYRPYLERCVTYPRPPDKLGKKNRFPPANLDRGEGECRSLLSRLGLRRRRQLCAS